MRPVPGTGHGSPGTHWLSVAEQPRRQFAPTPARPRPRPRRSTVPLMRAASQSVRESAGLHLAAGPQDGGSAQRWWRTGSRSRGASALRPTGQLAVPIRTRSPAPRAGLQPREPPHVLHVRPARRAAAAVPDSPARDRRWAWRGGCRLAWRGRAVGLARQENDEQHHDGETGHEPRLNAAREDASRHGSSVHDGNGSRRIRVVGHDYRSRCSKASFAFPSARYPRSKTFGTTYVPLCTWKFTMAGLPSLSS